MGKAKRTNIRDAVLADMGKLPGGGVIVEKSKVKEDQPQGAGLLSPTERVSDSDMDWAEQIGIFESHNGEYILAPSISRILVRVLQESQNVTALDLSTSILYAIVCARPEFDAKEILKAFSTIANFLRLQSFPSWIRPFIPEGD